MPPPCSPVPPTDLTERVSRFITEHIPSVERLEILLLLFETRERAWPVGEIEERIRSSRESVAKNLAAVTAASVVSRVAGATESYQYAGSAELDEVVNELATSYRTRRVAVIEQIYAERRDSIRSFSDAFKLGRPHDR